MKFNLLSILIFPAALLGGCAGGNNQHEKDKQTQTSGVVENNFNEDLNFLKKWDHDLAILSSDDSLARIIVSPKYQGKVFTSTNDGLSGQSFGWIHYSAFDQPVDSHMNGYGGEDRLWLGPEGGQFSLFFAPKSEMVFDNWHTPGAIDTAAWQLTSSSNKTVQFSKDMELLNYAGTLLTLNINRKVSILNNGDVEHTLDVKLPGNVKLVSYSTENVLKNTGSVAWDKVSGAPCLWNLDMFPPSPKTVIVIPYKVDGEGKVATTDYFGEIPSDRIKIENGVLYFRADGHSRGKLGIPPLRVKPVAGSYAEDKGLLTIIQFDIDRNGTYLNQEWTTSKDPFSGDVMNAYNDGPLKDGTQMGPFYELESVSPAAFLKPGEVLVHKHSVFHFTGGKDGLNAIAESVLGVGLDKISGVFE